MDERVTREQRPPRALGRPLTAGELERVLDRYPADLRHDPDRSDLDAGRVVGSMATAIAKEAIWANAVTSQCIDYS